MHELTKGDILTYITDTLGPHIKHIGGPDFEQAATFRDTLVHDIAEKAEGVFLWVYLVVRELIRGIRQRDTVLDLQHRLKFVPPHLEDYFEYMFLRSDDRVHRQKAAQVFLACSHSQQPIPLPAFALFDQENATQHVLAIDHKVRDLDWLRLQMIERYTRRLHGLCGDLLEVRKSVRGNNNRPLAIVTTVDFLHRSVKEYLDSQEIRTMMQQRAGETYDVDAMLCAVSLFLTKKWHAFVKVAGQFDGWPQEFLAAARRLDEKDGQDLIPLLESFLRVMKDGTNDVASNACPQSTHLGRDCDGLTAYYQDEREFVGMLKGKGFSDAVDVLLSADTARAASTSRSRKFRRPTFELEEDWSRDVQIREVKVSDMNIGDLMIGEATAAELLSLLSRAATPVPPQKAVTPPPKATGWVSWLLRR